MAPAPPGRRLGSEPKSHLPARCGEHTARVLGKLFAPGMATTQAGSWRNGPGIFANGLPGNYGHNHPRQVPVRYLGDNDGLRCVFTHRSSSTFSVVAGRIATCCACAACKPLIGDAARPSRLASQNLSRTRARRKTCQSTKQAVYWPTFGYRCRSVRPTEMPRLTQATPKCPVG